MRKACPDSPAGIRILVCTHATGATAVFLKTLTELGAETYYAPIQYNKNAASMGNITSIRGIRTVKVRDIRSIIGTIDVIVEDGGRVSQEIHKSLERLRLKKRLFSIEQTTSGIRRLAKLKMRYPVFNVAESSLKLGIENHQATPEAVISSMLSESGVSLSGMNVLVLGYGVVGSGIAMMCGAHGCSVTVVDSDSVRRVLAASRGLCAVGLDGMDSVIGMQDIIISCTTSTGDDCCLSVERFLLMKDGAMVINAGSGTGEVSAKMLDIGRFVKNKAEITVREDGGHRYCTFVKMGLIKQVTILGSGRPINLMCGDDTPSGAMDFVFSTILLILIKADRDDLAAGIHPVPEDIQQEVAATSEPTSYASQPELLQCEKLNPQGRPWGRLFRFSSRHELESFSLVRAVFTPGSKTDGHYHAVSEEAYVVESGTADIMTWNPQNMLESTTFSVKGDYLSIPRGMAHRVAVTSDEEFSCLVIASPPFSFWDQFFPQVPVGASITTEG